jgi:hypothetical protein
MGTVIVPTTYIMSIFSFSPDIIKYFIGNAFCRSDDSVTHLIHILHRFTINSVFYKPSEGKLHRSEILRTTVREWVPFFLSSYQETPERHEHDGSSEVVHAMFSIITGK